ncbi:MAG: SEL1-like repeat protein [Magnetococcales bacterium]|nr:SEL1-like repeat protein [Magnetococcales bacterium]
MVNKEDDGALFPTLQLADEGTPLASSAADGEKRQERGLILHFEDQDETALPLLTLEPTEESTPAPDAPNKADDIDASDIAPPLVFHSDEEDGFLTPPPLPPSPTGSEGEHEEEPIVPSLTFHSDEEDGFLTPPHPPTPSPTDGEGERMGERIVEQPPVADEPVVPASPFRSDEEDGFLVPPHSPTPSPTDGEGEHEAAPIAPNLDFRSDEEGEDDVATVVVSPSLPSSTTWSDEDDDNAATVIASPIASLPDTDDEDGGATVLAAPASLGTTTQLTANQPTQEEAPPPPPQASSSDNADVLRVGQMLMWYRIDKVLGQGGFGVTYKAFDTRLDTNVAIKEYLPSQVSIRRSDGSIHPRSAEHEAAFIKGRGRFLQEARTLAKFKHVSLVRVVTFFEEFNSAYMVMEYEDGTSMAAVLREKKVLDERELLAIILPLLQGISILHSEGFVHRDIKPDNIFIRHKDGSPVLLDFGSARQKTEGQESSGHMTAVLTPNYAPMEQYFEDAARQGPWTDIYAIGAVMYRSISGKKPVGSPQRSSAVMRGQPDPLIAAVEVGQGRYSESLLKAIDLALQIDEKDRPRTIAEWLRAVESEEGGQDEFVSAGLKALSSTGISTQARIIIGVLSLLLTLGVGYTFWFVMSRGDRMLTPEQVRANQLKQIQEKADQGDPEAMLQLAHRYEVGQDLPANRSYAFDWIRRAAEKGSAEAYYRLGMAHKTGEGTAKNWDEALRWLQKAVAANYPQAQFEVAQALESGNGVTRNIDTAITLYRSAATAGEPQAQYRVAQLFDQGAHGVQKDIDQAFGWYVKAAEHAIVPAQWRVAQMFELGQGTQADPNKALQFYRLVAEQNNKEAQLHLADALFQGTLGLQDVATALVWYTKAAQLGDVTAMMRLAAIYDRGEGGQPVNSGQAVHWYTKAAEAGHVEAQWIMGDKCSAGTGVYKDDGAAARWFLMAAEQGHAKAQNRYGEHKKSGLGVSKSATEAFQWFSRAAAQGLADAQNNLGLLYEKGNGVTQDYQQTLQWYLKAAQQDHAGAQSNLGWLYEEGKGVPANMAQAAHWYLKAAEQNDVRAQRNLGWMYEEGRGVPKDPVRAYFWYSLAAVQNDTDATNNLRMVSRKLSQDQVDKALTVARQWLQQTQSGGSAAP